MTIFRRLGELNYRSSYSHRGKYYTLDEVSEFDDLGWRCIRLATRSSTAMWRSTLGCVPETS